MIETLTTTVIALLASCICIDVTGVWQTQQLKDQQEVNSTYFLRRLLKMAQFTMLLLQKNSTKIVRLLRIHRT